MYLGDLKTNVRSPARSDPVDLEIQISPFGMRQQGPGIRFLFPKINLTVEDVRRQMIGDVE